MRCRWGVVAATLALAGALLFAPVWISDGQFLYRDAGRMHHPDKQWIAEALRSGHFPEWNRLAGLGVPVLGNAVDAPLHPLNLLLVLLPFEPAFSWWVLLSVLGAGLGAAAWARRLGRGTVGATTTGLAFMLSGFVVSSTDNLTYLTALACAPWMLAAGHAAATSFGPGPLLALLAASFLTAAAGDPMGWAVAAGLVLAQAMLVPSASPGRRLAKAAAMLAILALAAAPVLLPVGAWIPHSSRSIPFMLGEYVRWNLHPLRAAEFLVPHLARSPAGSVFSPVYRWYFGNEYSTSPWVLSIYLGAATMALAALGGARDRAAAALLVGAGILTWMAMGPYAGFGQLARALPLLSNLRFWEKLAAWTTLLVAAAAGSGAERLLSDRGQGRRLAVISGSIGTAMAGTWAALRVFPVAAARLVQLPDGVRLSAVLVDNLTDGVGAAALGLQLLALVAWSWSRGLLGRLAPAAVLLVVALDLGAANLRAYFLMPTALVASPTAIPDRLRAEPGLARVVTPFELNEKRWPTLTPVENCWRWAARSGAAAWNVAGRFGNLDAYTSMMPRRLMTFRTGLTAPDLSGRSALWGFQFVTVPGRLDLATTVGLFPPYDVVAVDPELPAFLLRRPARPRAYLAGPLTTVDEAGALQFVASPGAATSGRSVLEAPVPSGYRPPAGQARIVADEGERVDVTTDADGPALLILNDQHAPGWTATVDGRPAEILPANYLARGVWVPAGQHTVVFRYATPGLAAGLALALATLAALLAWGVVDRRRLQKVARADTSCM
jgi:hypothetical protein